MCIRDSLLTERVFKPTFLPALLSVRPCAGLLIPENLLAQSVPDHTEQLRGCVHASAGMRRLYLLGELLPLYLGVFTAAFSRCRVPAECLGCIDFGADVYKRQEATACFVRTSSCFFFFCQASSLNPARLLSKHASIAGFYF